MEVRIVDLKTKLKLPKGFVDITDPGYDSDVLLRYNSLEVKQGNYLCWYAVVNKGADKGRIARCGIVHTDYILERDLRHSHFGNISVDSGLAGFFVSPKHDYNDTEWKDFCDTFCTTNPVAQVIKEGFFTSSGIGDGWYPIYVHKKDKKIISVQLRFI